MYYSGRSKWVGKIPDTDRYTYYNLERYPKERVIIDGIQISFVENKDARHRSEYEYLWLVCPRNSFQRYECSLDNTPEIANLNYIYMNYGLLPDEYGEGIDDLELGMEEEPLAQPTDDQVDRTFRRVNMANWGNLQTLIRCFQRALYYFLRYLDSKQI